MAHHIDGHDLVRDLKIDFTVASVKASDPLIVALDTHSRRLAAAFDLKELKITETSPDVFDYSVETYGGREAEGVEDFTGDPSNPTLTCSTSGGGWSVKELEPFREFHAAWILVHNVLGANGFAVEFF